MDDQPVDATIPRSNLSLVPAKQDDNPLLISYYTLRRSVGVIGIALPFVLAIGKLLVQGGGLQNSISAYYYTVMRDVFVGSLCAIAVFLYTYRGYDWRDNVAGTVAGLAALGVALFPTTPEENPTAWQQLIGAMHLVSATVFFVTLAIFSLTLFTEMDKQHAPTPQKLQRNQVYRICGYTILLRLVAIGDLREVRALDAEQPVAERVAPALLILDEHEVGD